ncbi:hypothetical protein CEXT_83201 [Caerostris extrusa]|uniref:Uncharacterized protein n=1 Tax=Caerostris extrusa TaxID=172846 RepID=A0AAV4S5F6_CAEEX|nr:hypothetical protein CEXT_83201 [Caerostris extrusa]
MLQNKTEVEINGQNKRLTPHRSNYNNPTFTSGTVRSTQVVPDRPHCHPAPIRDPPPPLPRYSSCYSSRSSSSHYSRSNSLPSSPSPAPLPSLQVQLLP